METQNEIVRKTSLGCVDFSCRLDLRNVKTMTLLTLPFVNTLLKLPNSRITFEGLMIRFDYFLHYFLH